MEVLESPNKILIIQTAFIGDAILTLPMIQQLKKKDPSVLIDVISTPAAGEIFENCESVNKVIVYDKRGKDKSFSGLFNLAKQIRTGGYKKLYSPHRSFRSALLVFLSDIKETFGFSNSSFPFVFKNIIKYQESAHEVKRNLALAGFDISGENWKVFPELKQTTSSMEKTAAYVRQKIRYAAIAPGSVWETKKYPGEYYKKIIDFLISRGLSIFLIGGAADKEYCLTLLEGFSADRVINTAGELSITESVELLKNCELLICNDSAPTHFGMCAQIPVLTIYCSTIPEFGFYPYNPESRFISLDDLECKPCGIHGYKACPLGHFKCAHDIDVNRIKKEIETMLNERS